MSRSERAAVCDLLCFLRGITKRRFLSTSMHTWETIGLLWVILLYTPYTATVTRTFCRASPVFPGDPAKLTCYFHEDLRHSRTSFGVFQLDSDVSGSEMVLACIWDGGQPLCDADEGFHLVSHVSYEVTVEIPSHKPGLFFCETIPRKRIITASTCHFTLNASPTPSPTTVPPTSTEAKKTTEGRGDSDVVISLGLAIAALLVIVGVLLWLRDFFHGKFWLPSPEKASCDAVALPNLPSMLGVLMFS